MPNANGQICRGSKWTVLMLMKALLPVPGSFEALLSPHPWGRFRVGANLEPLGPSQSNLSAISAALTSSNDVTAPSAATVHACTNSAHRRRLMRPLSKVATGHGSSAHKHFTLDTSSWACQAFMGAPAHFLLPPPWAGTAYEDKCMLMSNVSDN